VTVLEKVAGAWKVEVDLTVKLFALVVPRVAFPPATNAPLYMMQLLLSHSLASVLELRCWKTSLSRYALRATQRDHGRNNVVQARIVLLQERG
jgi:hypothetical protein